MIARKKALLESDTGSTNTVRLPLTMTHQKLKPEFKNIKDLIHNKLSQTTKFLEDYIVNDKIEMINTPKKLLNSIDRPDKIHIFKMINPINEVDSGESSPFWVKELVTDNTEFAHNKSNSSEISYQFDHPKGCENNSQASSLTTEQIDFEDQLQLMLKQTNDQTTSSSLLPKKSNPSIKYDISSSNCNSNFDGNTKPKTKSRFGLFIEKTSITKQPEESCRISDVENKNHKYESLTKLHFNSFEKNHQNSSLKAIEIDLQPTVFKIFDNKFKLSCAKIGTECDLDESILIDGIEKNEILMNSNIISSLIDVKKKKKEDKKSSSLELFFSLDKHIMMDRYLSSFSP